MSDSSDPDGRMKRSSVDGGSPASSKGGGATETYNAPSTSNSSAKTKPFQSASATGVTEEKKVGGSSNKEKSVESTSNSGSGKPSGNANNTVADSSKEEARAAGAKRNEEEKHHEENEGAPDDTGVKKMEVDGGDSGHDEDETTGEASGETEKQEEQEEEEAQASSKAAMEQTYSTRGRSSTEHGVGQNSVSGQGGERGERNVSVNGGGGGVNSSTDQQWERSVRESLDQDMNASRKESSTTTPGTSFLESLSEEERRTRTRFLPDVEGMHMLRKNEIKGDLALARSMMSSAGVATTISTSKKSKKKVSTRSSDRSAGGDHEGHDGGAGKGNEMDIDEEEGVPPSEDERAAAADAIRLRGTTTSIEIGSSEIVLPSNVFVAPPIDKDTNGEVHKDDSSGKEDTNGKGTATSTTGGDFKSPLVVESVTAFNPPRPPESAGAKKKHRMLRWERRPADVEVDLSNYKKTVQRTRKELHTVELELERMESVGTHLRRHYLSHLKCLNEECVDVVKEFAAIQQECANAVDMLSSRPRSRGSHKSQNIMREVFAILKARGSELDSGPPKTPIMDLGEIMEKAMNASKNTLSGVGGSGSVGLSDWTQDTTVEPQKIAAGWTFPQDKVQTPYGEGVVIKVYGPSSLNPHEPPDVHFHKPSSKSPSSSVVPSKDSSKTTGMDWQYTATGAPTGNTNNIYPPSIQQPRRGGPMGFGRPIPMPRMSGGRAGTPNRPRLAVTGSNKTGGKEIEKHSLKVLPVRLCVRLPFGIGYFVAGSVSSNEKESSSKNYSPAKLGCRWTKLIESANMVSGSLDVQGMSAFLGEKLKKLEKRNASDDLDRDIDDAMDTEEGSQDENMSSNKVANAPKCRLIPFGSDLLPTSTGRGGIFTNGDIVQLEKEIHAALYDGTGVLGRKSNYGVPKEAKNCEEQRQELYTLQARVLQLRNELYRQRRIRKLNERTFAATRDRSLRVEGLVTQMRSDLKSLKNRLDEELRELGINDEKAESILKAFYLEQEEEEAEEEVTPPKRSRRLSREDYDDADHMDTDHASDMDHSYTGRRGSSVHSSDDDERESHSGRHVKRARHSQ